MPLWIQRLVLIAVILGAALGLAAALTTLKKPPPMRTEVDSSLLVDAVTLEPEQVSFVIPSQGTITPKTQTQLSAEVAGTVIAVADAFVAGGLFEAGEILLAIDPTNYRVALEQAQALVRQRQVEYDGAKRLREKGFRAEAEVASAEAALASARAELTRAQRDLSRTEIRLPYDGMVLSRAVDIGNYVSPGAPLGVTFATATAELRLPLTQAELGFLDLPGVADFAAEVDGPPVEVSASRGDAKLTWPARVVRTEGVVDETNRVTWVVAEIDDPYALGADNAGRAPLPIGSFVHAGIQGTTLDDVLKVPRTALRRGESVLLIDGDNRLRIRRVDVLRTDAEYAYVAAGIDRGERLVLTTIETPIDGMALRTGDSVVTGAGSGTDVSVN